MALREHVQPVRAARRHGRPKPFGGRLRLPTLRVSGAAMAMSTVVGISLATTWLLNEQQYVGRQPGMSVGASPPIPSPDSAETPATEPVASVSAATQAPSPSPTGHTRTPKPPQPGASKSPAQPTATPAPVLATAAPTATPDGTDPSAAASASPSPSTTGAAGPPRVADVPPRVGSVPPPTAPAPTPTPIGSVPPPTAPTPTPVGSVPPPATPAPTPVGDDALCGSSEREHLGSSGVRHTVHLRVGEELTALQVELRLKRPEVLPGTTPWTDLPDTVVTVSLDRDTLVYRFTLAPGEDVPAGDYTFTVFGTSGKKLHPAANETWSASAFALKAPRAVATRGVFS